MSITREGRTGGEETQKPGRRFFRELISRHKKEPPHTKRRANGMKKIFIDSVYQRGKEHVK